MRTLGLLFLTIIASVKALNDGNELEYDHIIEAVNSANTTWKASRNFHPSLKKNYINNDLFESFNLPTSLLQPLIKTAENKEAVFLDLPKNFDAREKWKYCRSLHEVRDQGSCGSCWSVSATSAFSDRLCIASNGSFNGQLSAQHLLTCCSECGFGCQGGSPGLAWLYFKEEGIVSGGNYNSKEGCQPYTFPTCEHYVTGPRNSCRDDYENMTTPECAKECYNKQYKGKQFQDDLHTVSLAFSASILNFEPKDREFVLRTLQHEIYMNGPLTTSFAVHEDFLAYKTGVYQYVAGDYVYGHTVKVIGWGEEEGIPYWLVANSWNSDWGDNGFFKIRRGVNERGFEEEFQGGVPNI